ncbi:uncharacterized protein LOC116454488 isoform X2 [Corvus moneduloides]|uniref:uncharacterized protein LOC116454488 isoform X2 n=1 Tax=Corvus moneduloides TaxID=1196302 RepID=UPI001362AF15|nr:uncharacterized protein LOC116454488 isoform X2 [Corvus moneduloides]
MLGRLNLVCLCLFFTSQSLIRFERLRARARGSVMFMKIKSRTRLPLCVFQKDSFHTKSEEKKGKKSTSDGAAPAWLSLIPMHRLCSAPWGMKEWKERREKKKARLSPALFENERLWIHFIGSRGSQTGNKEINLCSAGDGNSRESAGKFPPGSHTQEQEPGGTLTTKAQLEQTLI